MTNIAVFASGNGSNFQAIIDAIQSGDLAAEVKLLVCDKQDAFVLKRAKQSGIDTFAFQPKAYDSKAAFERQIAAELEKLKIEYLVLAGYMRLIGPTLLERFSNKIINIHPSLLPAFPGIDAIGQALRAGVEETGVTIHFVDEGMDTGPMIAQKRVKICSEDTAETLAAKIHELEHRFYPATLQQLFHQASEGAENGKKSVN